MMDWTTFSNMLFSVVYIGVDSHSFTSLELIEPLQNIRYSLRQTRCEPKFNCRLLAACLKLRGNVFGKHNRLPGILGVHYCTTQFLLMYFSIWDNLQSAARLSVRTAISVGCTMLRSLVEYRNRTSMTCPVVRRYLLRSEQPEIRTMRPRSSNMPISTLSLPFGEGPMTTASAVFQNLSLKCCSALPMR